MLNRIIIKNFKSIDYLDINFKKNIQNLHSFIGVNESGKSNILRAINCLSKGFKTEDLNVKYKNPNDSYIIFFVSLTDEDLEKIKNFGFNGLNELLIISKPGKDNSLLSKEDINYYFGENIYNSANCINYFFGDINSEYDSYINNLFDKVENMYKETHPELLYIWDEIYEIVSIVNRTFDISDFDLKNFYSGIEQFNIDDFFDKDSYDYDGEIRKSFEKISLDFNNIRSSLSNFLNNNLWKNDEAQEIINNIQFTSSYISTYNSDLKNHYSWEEIKKKDNLFLLSLIKASNVSYDDLKDFFENKNLSIREEIVKKFNLKFKNDLDFFHTTNQVEIKCEIDTGIGLSFFVYDKYSDKSLTIDERSDGFKQFLVLLIIFDKINYNKNYSLLLLDEPGYSLHPKAQISLINKMFDWSKSIQIFYTTHLPFLIHDDLFCNVNFVIRENDKGTQIEKYPFSGILKTKDDPLFPIFINLGIDVENSLTFPKTKNVCIVEGVSDFYYIKLFFEIVKDDEINSKTTLIIPKFGSNMPLLLAFLLSFQKKYLYLIDSDKNNKIKNEIKSHDLEEKILDYASIFKIENHNNDSICIENIVFNEVDSKENNKEDRQQNKIKKAMELYFLLKDKNFDMENIQYNNIDFVNLKEKAKLIVESIKEKFKKIYK